MQYKQGLGGSELGNLELEDSELEEMDRIVGVWIFSALVLISLLFRCPVNVFGARGRDCKCIYPMLCFEQEWWSIGLSCSITHNLELWFRGLGDRCDVVTSTFATWNS